MESFYYYIWSCITITTIWFKKIFITPKRNPVYFSSHSLFSPSHQTLATTKSAVFMNLSILEYHINGITQYLVFYIWQYINIYVIGLFYVTCFQVLPIHFYSWIIPLCWYTTVCLSIHQVIDFFFWLYWAARGILFPWPGIEPVLPAVEARSLNHWTSSEVHRW